ncbi:MAG: hypothetical protein JNM31_08425 [Flavobacteriales bacterium]|nr:hypothetical protein [Flavobacteriales bacterium]
MNIRSLGIAGVILGILFKVLHWPGANIILMTSTALTIVMLVILLVRKPGPWTLHVQRPAMLFGSIVTALTGMLFKVMHWPGANMLLLLGMVTCAAWFLTSAYHTRTSVVRS